MRSTSLLVTVLTGMLFTAYDVAAQNRVDAPMLLEQASHARMVEGDLDQAISLYTQVAMSATASRNNVAQALVALGDTYELQGSPEAIPAYERVVSEFADQPVSFLAANAKLAALSTSSSAASVAGGGKAGADYMLVFEKLFPSKTLQPRMHDFSPDGKELLYVATPSSERKKQFPALRFEIYVRDTVGAVGRPLIEDAGDWEYINRPRWSPDGKHIFYHSSIGGSTSREERRLMLFDVHSQESRQLGGEFLELADEGYRDTEWMPDSSGLVMQLTDNGYRIIGLDGVEKKRFPRLKGSRCDPIRMGSVSPDGRYLLLHACTAGMESRTETDIWQLNLENGEYSELTNDAGYEGWPVWNRDGTQIYYVSGPEAARNVYRRKPGSEEPPVKVTAYINSSAIYPRILPRDGQLTFVLMRDNSVIFTADTGAMSTAAAVVRGSKPMPSPDGKFLYYLNDQPNHVGLWKISVKGENPEQLVSGHVITSYGPRSLLSPDGSTIAYAQFTGDTTSLFVMPSAGGKATSVYSANGVRHLIPAWSPNSKEIAFAIDGDMMVIPANGGDVTVLASVKDWEPWSLEWSPDGKSIAGFAYLEGEKSNHVMIVDRTTKKLTRATPQSEDQYKEILAWHPDGNRISYMYYNVGDWNGSRIVDLETSKITDLVNMPDPNWDYYGKWGPDKRYYFLSSERGLRNSGVYAFDEGSGKYQQIRQFHDRWVDLPSWSANGSLTTWSETEPVRQIWMMTNYE